MSGTGIAQDHLGVALISLLNMDIMNYPRLTIPNAMQQLDEHGKLALKESAPLPRKTSKCLCIHFIERRKAL